MWPCFPIFVNKFFSSSLLRSHLPARLGGMRGAFEYGAPLAGASRVRPLLVSLISLTSLLKETERGLAHSPGPGPA